MPRGAAIRHTRHRRGVGLRPGRDTGKPTHRVTRQVLGDDCWSAVWDRCSVAGSRPGCIRRMYLCGRQGDLESRGPSSLERSKTEQHPGKPAWAQDAARSAMKLERSYGWGVGVGGFHKKVHGPVSQ
jgi:hypothetical protein